MTFPQLGLIFGTNGLQTLLDMFEKQLNHIVIRNAPLDTSKTLKAHVSFAALAVMTANQQTFAVPAKRDSPMCTDKALGIAYPSVVQELILCQNIPMINHLNLRLKVLQLQLWLLLNAWLAPLLVKTAFTMKILLRSFATNARKVSPIIPKMAAAQFLSAKMVNLGTSL